MNDIFWNEAWNTWKEDWSQHGASPDQARIVQYLKDVPDHTSKNLLHVGTGDSSLAVELRDFKIIDGVTVLDTEIQKATYIKTLNKLWHYNVYLCNKHTYNFLLLPNKYDYIVDNGIFTFTDCFICAHNTLLFFYHLLNQNGMILTDTKGLMFCKSISVNLLKRYLVEHQIYLEVCEFGNISGEHVVGLRKIA